ncbi:SMP-30/gluconolactonase/LRE family protein [Streptomyces coffeae]|uniref:SMP-30/gluconolactonase/LRE family protein n=1 Tax=Streptomyces coffeae TaxID=621382 RepID=A0ABS1NMQ9_9ACTN|nr:SMP-30/gluconolactonase/LRE family protein [Streptomyces coffeae]MBL1101378.1 SMP-30/gluconolactonase/LRE family protein [Streptomyces coffeae]
MPRALPRRTLAVAITALASVLPLAPAAQATAPADAPATRPAAHHPVQPRISAAYELPGDRVYPEGIAADPRSGTLYAGSFADGTVYRMTPGRRAAEVLLPAGTDGRTTANGLKVDGAGRLWVTDSTAGVSVYDPRTRRLLARFDVPGQGARFVNDLAIAPDGSAYLTDSARAVVYRVTPHQLAHARAHGGRAVLTPRFDLNGAMQPHDPGTYTLNGIVADPTGRYLLTVDMTGGDLYRLDLSSGRIRRVALHGGDLRLADGLELRHGTLWAAHNTGNAISRWRVSADGHAARQERRFTDETLQVPTTLIRRHGTLYVVRSQFDKGGPLGDGTPRTPFTVAAVNGI